MVTCPRCQQPVDESFRATCPLCFTPIPQAAQAAGPLAGMSTDASSAHAGLPQQGQAPQAPNVAAYPQPGFQQPLAPNPGVIPGAVPPVPRPPMNPGARISLTGEVIESGAPAGPPPSYVGASAAAPARIPRPDPALRANAPEKAAGGNVVGIVAALVVILGGGFGAWYWWMHRTNPKDQALAVYKAYLSQDYKAAYGLSALGSTAIKVFPDAETFAVDQENKVAKVFGNNSPVMAAAKAAASTASVSDPVITGDKADVPTSCDLTILGRSIKVKGTAHMVNDNGIWKLDMKTEDLQKANQATLDMVGRPDLSGLGGR